MDAYEREAERLLADVNTPPWAERSRRICALYACFFLEDPLLYSWCGLASFVGRQVYLALEDASPFTRRFDAFFAAGNAAIYRSFMPALLRFRDGAPQPDGHPLATGFDLLARARDARTPRHRHDRAWEALLALADAEQAEVVQPLYAKLSRFDRRALAWFYHFRMGWDCGAPVIRFSGNDPGDLAQRRRWMQTTILPRWREALDTRIEALRRDCDENRRAAGVRASRLPPIVPYLPVVPPFPKEPAVGGVTWPAAPRS